MSSILFYLVHHFTVFYDHNFLTKIVFTVFQLMIDNFYLTWSSPPATLYYFSQLISKFYYNYWCVLESTVLSGFLITSAFFLLLPLQFLPVLPFLSYPFLKHSTFFEPPKSLWLPQRTVYNVFSLTVLCSFATTLFKLCFTIFLCTTVHSLQ